MKYLGKLDYTSVQIITQVQCHNLHAYVSIYTERRMKICHKWKILLKICLITVILYRYKLLE